MGTIDRNITRTIDNSRNSLTKKRLKKASIMPSNDLAFREWVYKKYAKSHAPVVYNYARKYSHLLDNPRDIELIKDSIKNNVIKSLISLSKYIGQYETFKAKLKSYGITMNKQNSVDSFLRILKASESNSNVLEWVTEANEVLRPNEKTLLKLAKFSGLRKEEAIQAFNLIVQLSKDNKLPEYYDKNLNCLCHFKYPKIFLRNTKNVFISFVPQELINEITESESLTYTMIIKRLRRKHMKVRINELRDFFGTYLLHHGMLEQEVNLLQGRIPVSVFVRHYWSPKLAELRDRIFKALEELN